jgi:hypothetical protein
MDLKRYLAFRYYEAKSLVLSTIKCYVISCLIYEISIFDLLEIKYALFYMKEQVNTLIEKLKDHSLPFKALIELIETDYHHQPTAFKNGEAFNESTQNQGSAKVFAFAQLNDLSKEDTLYLFAEHYQSVLNTPDGTDHQNIRQFMTHGWSGISFEGSALIAK